MFSDASNDEAVVTLTARKAISRLRELIFTLHDLERSLDSRTFESRKKEHVLNYIEESKRLFYTVLINRSAAPDEVPASNGLKKASPTPFLEAAKCPLTLVTLQCMTNGGQGDSPALWRPRFHVAAIPLTPSGISSHSHRLLYWRLREESEFGLSTLQTLTKIRTWGELQQSPEWVRLESLCQGTLVVTILGAVRLTLIPLAAQGIGFGGGAWNVVAAHWAITDGAAEFSPAGGKLPSTGASVSEPLKEGFRRGFWYGCRVTSALVCGVAMEVIAAQCELLATEYPLIVRLDTRRPTAASVRMEFFFAESSVNVGALEFSLVDPQPGSTDPFRVLSTLNVPNHLGANSRKSWVVGAPVTSNQVTLTIAVEDWLWEAFAWCSGHSVVDLAKGVCLV
jgi:hypothetical protein